LAAADRTNSMRQRELAVSYAKLALVHLRLGDAAQALTELRSARDIMGALVTAAPDNAQWQKELALFDGEIARLEGQAQETTKN